MTFVYIPPGRFSMGSPSSEPYRDSDEKPHGVTLSRGYYLQATEVTQGQWQAVMNKNPSHFDKCGDDCPVEQVSWEQVQDFIGRLNRLEEGKTYRLPTEAEWEYAARAGSDTAFASGGITEKKCGHDPHLDPMGWYCGNSAKSTHPVGMKKPNAWGLYDMHGNVYEWCHDWYGDYPPGPVVDPVGPSDGSYRVRRGGSWLNHAGNSRSASRDRFLPVRRYRNLGFRLLRTP